MTPSGNEELKKLQLAITNIFGKDIDAEAIAKTVVDAIKKQSPLSYSKKEKVRLIGTTGRVLVSVMQDETLTQRSLALYLGTTESNIQKSIKQLVDAGLIAKTKNNSRNVYKVNKNAVISHPDIARLIAAISGC